MITEILAYLCFALAAVSWLVAVVSAFGMFDHIEKGRGFMWFATNGNAFFTGKGFAPEAAPYRRRFRIAAGCFILFVVLGIVAGLVFSQQPATL